MTTEDPAAPDATLHPTHDDFQELLAASRAWRGALIPSTSTATSPGVASLPPPHGRPYRRPYVVRIRNLRVLWRPPAFSLWEFIPGGVVLLLALLGPILT
jgi:hypothetical protein